ncbi:MAG: hypothetical protein R3Y11_05610 [Pseudomonadota bacterium]
MKKIAVALLTVGILSSFGCAQKEIEATNSGYAPQAPPEGMCMPAWELAVPTSPDGFYGSGQAQYSSPVLSRDAADARARQAIASTLETKTAGMVKTFIQQNGTGEAASTSEFAESVSKTVVVKSLQNASIEQRHVCPDGTWYSLAYYPFEMYANYIVEAAQETPATAPEEKNVQDAFLAKDALDTLQLQIDEAFAE